MKRLAKGRSLQSLVAFLVLSRLRIPALPSKPLNQISLSDADNASALSFVKQKLRDSGLDVQFTNSQTSYIERLGGRASDLESVGVEHVCNLLSSC